MNTEIIFVRHGETDLNKRKVYFGHLDPQLNEQGILEIKKTAEILKNHHFDFIYSSDLSRCFKTAEIINNYHGLEITLSKEFRELNFGIFEGKTYNEITTEFPKEVSFHFDLWKNYCIPNGESPLEAQNRTIKQIKQILKMHSGKNILISAHSGTIRNVLSYYLCDELNGFWKFFIDHGSISKLIFTPDNFVYAEYINRI